jgi:hypothetical protein
MIHAGIVKAVRVPNWEQDFIGSRRRQPLHVLGTSVISHGERISHMSLHFKEH